MVRMEARTPGPELEARLVDLVKGAAGVTPIIVFVTPGSLNAGTGKARQFVDLRDE